MKKYLTYFQYFLPQHFITHCMSYVGNAKNNWFKNKVIHWFIQTYQVDMSEAIEKDPEKYDTFNDFFTRHLDVTLRPLVAPTKTIASPVDGTVSEFGRIQKRQLLQAKEMYFDLKTLLANDETLATTFENGQFATLYLAPHNYHRVHMPMTGKLIKCIYVPGKLFSVNRMTAETIPNLFARNERLITIFETEAGFMSVIFVGALIVGSMQTVWMSSPIRGPHIQDVTPTQSITLEKGQELGWFQMGSTVIVLFETNKTEWQPALGTGCEIQFGQWLASY